MLQLFSRRLGSATARTVKNVSIRSGGFRYFNSTGISKIQENVDKEIKTMTIDQLAETGKIDSNIIDSLKFRKYTALTPVQEKTIIPILEEEKGVVVRAKTGTGKTLAFLIPILQDLFPSRTHSLKNKHKVFHLIIAPTRDLAEQIEEELINLVYKTPELNVFKSRIVVLTGGRRMNFDLYFSPSIVIATPGRLSAVLQDKKYLTRFNKLRSRVYDESDRILEQGFKQDLDFIDERLRSVNVKNTNEGVVSYKSVLFSATIDKNVDNFAKQEIGPNYAYLDCNTDEDQGEAHENIHQVLIKTDNFNESVVGSLAYLIKRLKPNNRDRFKAIVFLPTITGVDWYFDMINQIKRMNMGKDLNNDDLRIFKLHGGLTQATRHKTVKTYRHYDNSVLVCTDVAARGLDFPDVTHVIQLSPSIETASYIHKIGRTARAGAKGTAIIYAHKHEMNYINALEDEKNIRFDECLDYKEFPQDASLVEQLKSDSELLDEFIKSFCSFNKQISSIYNSNIKYHWANIVEFLRYFEGNESAKINIKPSFLQKVLDVPREDAILYFEIPLSYNHTKKKKGGSNSGGGNSGGHIKGDRFGKFDSNNNRGNYGRPNNNRGNYGRSNNNGGNYGRSNYNGGNYGRSNYNGGNYGRSNYNSGNYGRSNYNRDNYRRSNYNRDNFEEPSYGKPKKRMPSSSGNYGNNRNSRF